MNKLLLTTLGLVIAVGFALGCGSGEDEATSADEAPPLTKPQFIKQADAICTQAIKERERAVNSWMKELPGGDAEAQASIDKAVVQIVPPLLHKEVTRLEALSAPKGDEATVAEVIDLLVEVKNSVAREYPNNYTPDGFGQFQNKATAYGLNVCPSPV